MNNCRDNHRRNGGQENWNQMHNPRFASNKQRHEFHGYNIRPPNPHQWRPDSSFRGRDQRWGMHPPNNQYNSFNFRSMPFPRPNRFAWNVNHQNEFGPPPDYHPQMQLYQEFDQDISEQNSSKPREHPYDKNLHDTIDSVKRKLSARQANMAVQEIPPAEDPQLSNHDILKSSEKRRIEHSKMLPKAATAKKSERRETLALKLKNSNTQLAPPNLLQKKSQMMRRKILQQLFKMNKNDLRKVLSHPDSLTKYDFALQSLIKETRNTLSRQLRAVAEKSLQHYDTTADPLQGEKIVQDAFMGHLETMLDTDASLELSNMEPQVIAELSKVLQEDLMGPTNDDSVIPSFARVINEPVSEESIQNSANKQRCFDEARKDDDTFLLHINNEIQASIFKGDSIFTGLQPKNDNQPMKSWKDYLLIQSADSPLCDNDSDNFCDVSENQYFNLNTQNLPSEYPGECSNWRTSQIPKYCINSMNSAPLENNQFPGNSNSDGFPSFSNNTAAGSDLSNSKLHKQYYNVSASNQHDGYSSDNFYQHNIEIDRGYVTNDNFTVVTNEKSQDSKSDLFKDCSKISSSNNCLNSFNYSNDGLSDNQSNYRSNSDRHFPNKEVNTSQSMDCNRREIPHSSETSNNNICTNPAASDILSPEMDNVSASSLEIPEEPIDEQTLTEGMDSHRAPDISIVCRNTDSTKNINSFKNSCVPNIIKPYENTVKRRRTNSLVNLSHSESLPLNPPCVNITNDTVNVEIVNGNIRQDVSEKYPTEEWNAENQTQSIVPSVNNPLLKSMSSQTVQPELKSKGIQSHNIGKTNASSQVYASLIHSKSKGTQYSSTNIKTCSCQNSSSKEYGRSKGQSARVNNKLATARETQTDSTIAFQNSDFGCQVSLPAQELARPNKTGKSLQENDENYLDVHVPYKSSSILEQMKLIDSKIQILIQEKFKLYNRLENSNTKPKKVLGVDTSSSHKTAIRFQKSSKVSSHKKINSSQKNDLKLLESSKVLRQSLTKSSKSKPVIVKDEPLYKTRGNKIMKNAEPAHNSRKKINNETKELNLPFPSTSTPRSTRRTRSQDSEIISKSDDPVNIVNNDEIKIELEKTDLSVCEEDYLAAFQEYGDINNICLETLGFPMSLDDDFVAFDEAFDVKNIDTITDDHSLIKTSMDDDNFQCSDLQENNIDTQSTCEGSNTPASIDLEKSNSSSCTSNKSIMQEKSRGGKNLLLENNPNKNIVKTTSIASTNNRISRKNISNHNKRQHKPFANSLDTVDSDLHNSNAKDKKNSGKRSRTTSETKSINGTIDKNVLNKSDGNSKVSKKEKLDQNISPSIRIGNKDESPTSHDKKKSSKHGDKFSNTNDINSKNRYISRISDSKIRIINRPTVPRERRSSPNSKSKNILTKKEISKPVKGGNRSLNTSKKLDTRSNSQSVRGKKIILKNTDKEPNKNSPLCSLMSQLDDSDNESDLDLSNIEKPMNVESIMNSLSDLTKEHSIGDSVDIPRGGAQSDWNEFAIKECTVVLDRINVPLAEDSASLNVDSSSIFHTNLKDISTVRFKDHNKDFPISIYQVNNAANKSTDELDVSNVIGVIGASDTLDIINNWDSLIFDNVSACENMEVYANETVILEDESAPINTIYDEMPLVKNDHCVELKNNIDNIIDFDIRGSDYPINYTDHKDSIIAIECVNNQFLAASLDGNVYHYSTTDKSLLKTFNVSELAVTSLCVIKQRSQQVLYAGSLDSYLRCYNIESGVKFNADTYLGSPIQSMYHSMDTIYIGTRTGVISQYDLKTNSLLPDNSIKFADNAILALHAIKEGARKILLIASRSQKVTVRDANTGLLLRMFNGPDSTIYSLLFDSGRVICGTKGNDIQVFDFVTGEIIAIHKGGNGAVCLKMYRGLLFVGCYDGKIYIFKVGLAEEPVACIPGPGKMLLAMAIKDDKIIAGCNDHSLSIWPLPNEVLEHFDSH